MLLLVHKKCIMSMACQVIGLDSVVVLCLLHSFEILFGPALTIWWNPYSPSFAIYIESEYLWVQRLYELVRKGLESVTLSSLTRDRKGGRFFTIARRLHGCDTNCIPISFIYAMTEGSGRFAPKLVVFSRSSTGLLSLRESPHRTVEVGFDE